MKPSLLCFALLCLCACSKPVDKIVVFDGQPFGCSIKNYDYLKGSEKRLGGIIFSEEQMKSGETRYTVVGTREAIRDIPIRGKSFVFNRGKLAAVEYTLEDGMFGAAKKLLTDLYGAPDEQSLDSVKWNGRKMKAGVSGRDFIVMRVAVVNH